MALRRSKKGVPADIGDGANLWPSAHRLDAARFHRLAPARGGCNKPFHAASEDEQVGIVSDIERRDYSKK